MGEIENSGEERVSNGQGRRKIKKEEEEMRRKILSMLLIVTLVFALPATSFASEQSIDIAETYLIEKGFPQDVVDSISDEEIVSIYNQIKDIPTGQAVHSRSYVNEENLGDIELRDSNLPEKNMALDIVCLPELEEYNSVKSKIKRVKVFVLNDWKSGKPAIQKTDAIAVNWESSTFALTEDSFLAQYYVNITGKETKYKTLKRFAKTSQGGCAWYFEFASGGTGTCRGHSYFELTPKKTLYYYNDSSKNSNSSNVNVDYCHDGNPAASMSFSVVIKNIVEVTIVPEASYTYRAADFVLLKYKKA